MGQFSDEIPEYLFDWISKQQMFWVASAPLSADGHINISPKGIDGTFHIVNSRKVWYQDLSGSGAETVAHIRENGRVSILFHAFEGPARIVRLYGKGFFHQIGSPEYEAMLPVEDRIPGSRAVIGLDVTKVCTTCGFSVPYYQFLGHRSQLIDWAKRKEAVDIKDAKDSPVASSSSPAAHLSPLSSSALWMERLNPNGTSEAVSQIDPKQKNPEQQQSVYGSQLDFKT
ncbi:hypothetical protein CPB83DRAFT_891767 [Crepidotus variabilis]|uniref:Pyridoxamine 5'-phosphate oxidase N-terminal domain-containing protein n=1 Tax=Crepidotus variabilis TaxID=179855 RepID=A0A9P6JTB2_9AGAR|nr:hypothetical protein CPB83DRAFT_891767 [Crepidotus variabilis]